MEFARKFYQNSAEFMIEIVLTFFVFNILPSSKKLCVVLYQLNDIIRLISRGIGTFRHQNNFFNWPKSIYWNTETPKNHKKFQNLSVVEPYKPF